MALFYATSSDGRRFTTRQQIPTEGVPRHSQIAVGADGAVTVVWDEQVNGGAGSSSRRGHSTTRAESGLHENRSRMAPAVTP